MNDTIIERHKNIISTVLQWKVIYLYDLKRAAGYLGSDPGLRQIILHLEKAKILNSSYGVKGVKIVYPSGELLKAFNLKKIMSINYLELYHEVTVTSLLLKLIDYPLFIGMELPHHLAAQNRLSLLEPDAILRGDRSGKTFNVGIEVELTRKCRNRIFLKIEKYIESPMFDYVFYFFINKSHFISYQKRISELCENLPRNMTIENINHGVALIYIPMLMQHCSFEDATVFFNNEEKPLDIFLEGREKEKEEIGGKLRWKRGGNSCLTPALQETYVTYDMISKSRVTIQK